MDKGMDSEDSENNKYCSGIMGCVDKYLGLFLKTLPLFVVLSVIPVFHYANEENIGIFSHYFSWVSFLPVIMVAEAIIGVVVLICYFSIVFYIDRFSFQYRGNKLCYKDQPIKCYPLVVFQYICLVLVPVLYAHYYLPDVLLKKNINFWVFLYPIFFALINTLFVCKILVSKVRSTNQSWVNSLVDVARPYHLSDKIRYKELLKSAVLSFLVPFIAISMYFAIAKYSYHSESLDIWVVFLVAILALISLTSSGILYLYPLTESQVRLALGFFFVILFVFLFSTPISVKISDKALELLRVGGGVKRIYYVEKENKSNIPDEYLNDNCCVDSFCFTNELSIIWGVGDLVYVDVPSKKNPPIKQHIAIPRNILMPYNLDEPLPDVCKTEEELEEAANKGQKEQK